MQRPAIFSLTFSHHQEFLQVTEITDNPINSNFMYDNRFLGLG